MPATISEDLLDFSVKYQVVLERLKAGNLRRASARFVLLSAQLRELLSVHAAKSSMASLSVAKKRVLIKRAKELSRLAYAEVAATMVAELRSLAEETRLLELAALDAATVDDVEPDDGELFPVLWDKIQERPLSGTGDLLPAFIASWVVQQTGLVGSVLRKNIVNGVSGAATLKDVMLAARGMRAYQTVLNTSVQHTGTVSRFLVAEASVYQPVNSTTAKRRAARQAQVSFRRRDVRSKVRVNEDGFVTAIPVALREQAKKSRIAIGTYVGNSRYLWVSVLDSKTSAVCRSLDGEVFVYGTGPVPPAHPNCRSSIVNLPPTRFLKKALVGYTRPTYYEWLKKQSKSTQDAVLGVTRAKIFRTSSLTARQFADLTISSTFEPLTLDEMRKLAPEIFKQAGA
jgi:hypothetical protein